MQRLGVCQVRGAEKREPAVGRWLLLAVRHEAPGDAGGADQVWRRPRVEGRVAAATDIDRASGGHRREGGKGRHDEEIRREAVREVLGHGHRVNQGGQQAVPDDPVWLRDHSGGAGHVDVPRCWARPPADPEPAACFGQDRLWLVREQRLREALGRAHRGRHQHRPRRHLRQGGHRIRQLGVVRLAEAHRKLGVPAASRRPLRQPL
mmetsp:Transcript_39824/g.112541  ORF Transcript_39824/g.112541 Transcript_39824/m.112541 type:complete len:206 (-) Transcript_39824:413-1030(-)